jgi:hypothetical protein
MAKKTRASLIKKLDKVFSEYIRRKDASKDGMARCVTCGKTAHWKEMDNGHYWSRRYTSTRWDENNCGVQCTYCNRYNQGNAPAFTMHLLRKHGQEFLEQLEQKKNETAKLGILDLELMIEEYLDKLHKL